AGKPNLITLAWAGVCCSEPPSVQVSLRKDRYSHSAIMERKAFSVNVPSKKYLTEADYAGIVSGRNVNKFETAGLTPLKGEAVDAPLVAEFPVSMECKMTHVLELGSHDLFVGQIMACWIEEEALREGSNKVNADRIDPLIYMPGGEYFGLGEFLSPGYTAGRKLIKK
ncbi:MAG: flavin reductase family protein, partial [Synergistaceae bacterium]|nr:flavin reductase family protein [Synergistaceae bacterium]